MTKIVGIGGLLRHGKDEVADRLVAVHGWIKMGMSDPLNDALLTLDPWIAPMGGFDPPTRYGELHDSVGYVEAKTHPEVRRLLQKLGTEVGRDMIGQNTWTDIMVRNVRRLSDDGVPGIIVTGVRFPNEIRVVKEELGGDLWWVNRPSLGETVHAGHASENSVSGADFDIIIENDKTLKDLYAKVDSLI